MEFESKVKQKVLSGQSREILANVIRFMRREAAQNEPIINIKKVQERVAVAAGVSVHTISNIEKEMRKIENGESSSFSTPNTRRKVSHKKTHLDNVHVGVLRRYISNYQLTNKKAPPLRNIHKMFHDDCGYAGSRESFRKMIHSLGFRWRKTDTNRLLLIENPDNRQKRANFLRNINPSHTHKKSLDDDTNEGPLQPVSKEFYGDPESGTNDPQQDLIKELVKKEEPPSSTDYHNEYDIQLTESDEVGVHFEHIKIEKIEPSESELLFSCEVCKKVFVNEKDLLEHKSGKIDCIALEVDESEWNQEDKSTQDFGVPRTAQNDDAVLEETTTEDHFIAVCENNQRSPRENFNDSPVEATEGYQCNTCLKYFSTKSGLACHERIHTGERPFQCEICSKSFVRNAHLLEHKILHEGVEPFRCKVCSKTFKLPSYLSNHERMHKPEKQFFCKFCPKSFIRNYRMLEHQTIHTGERQYTCQTCSKTFMRKSYLFKHEKTHTSDKPFKCKICSKSFKLNSYLIDHEYTHNPDKTFSCNLCSKLFLNKSSMCRHKKSHIKEEVI